MFKQGLPIGNQYKSIETSEENLYNDDGVNL